jgi:hypothetical protein
LPHQLIDLRRLNRRLAIVEAFVEILREAEAVAVLLGDQVVSRIEQPIEHGLDIADVALGFAYG